jgi:hypothetical protein
MYKPEVKDTIVSKHSYATSDERIEISFEDARQGDDVQSTLLVLAFSLAGAIVGNTLVLVALS